MNGGAENTRERMDGGTFTSKGSVLNAKNRGFGGEAPFKEHRGNAAVETQTCKGPLLVIISGLLCQTGANLPPQHPRMGIFPPSYLKQS